MSVGRCGKTGQPLAEQFTLPKRIYLAKKGDPYMTMILRYRVINRKLIPLFSKKSMYSSKIEKALCLTVPAQVKGAVGSSVLLGDAVSVILEPFQPLGCETCRLIAFKFRGFFFMHLK